MLVLSRKVNERILIGNDITITIIRVVGQNVRVGIEAPVHIPVRRAEIPETQPQAPARPSPPPKNE